MTTPNYTTRPVREMGTMTQNGTIAAAGTYFAPDSILVLRDGEVVGYVARRGNAFWGSGHLHRIGTPEAPTLDGVLEMMRTRIERCLARRPQ